MPGAAVPFDRVRVLTLEVVSARLIERTSTGPLRVWAQVLLETGAEGAALATLACAPLNQIAPSMLDATVDEALLDIGIDRRNRDPDWGREVGEGLGCLACCLRVQNGEATREDVLMRARDATVWRDDALEQLLLDIDVLAALADEKTWSWWRRRSRRVEDGAFDASIDELVMTMETRCRDRLSDVLAVIDQALIGVVSA